MATTAEEADSGRLAPQQLGARSGLRGGHEADGVTSAALGAMKVPADGSPLGVVVDHREARCLAPRTGGGVGHRGHSIHGDGVHLIIIARLAPAP